MFKMTSLRATLRHRRDDARVARALRDTPRHVRDEILAATAH